jgi:hypothetical protein
MTITQAKRAHREIIRITFYRSPGYPSNRCNVRVGDNPSRTPKAALIQGWKRALASYHYSRFANLACSTSAVHP